MFKTDDKPRGLMDPGEMRKATPSVPTGWKCPVCRSVNAPHVNQCKSCDPRVTR